MRDFRAGGSIDVPRAGDSKFVMFRMTPGERVCVRTPSQRRWARARKALARIARLISKVRS